MADVRAIREALAANVETVKGEIDFDMQISPYKHASLTPPCAWLLLSEQDYPDGQHTFFETFTFGVHVAIWSNLDEAAQMRLDELLATEAMTSAIESDPQLGGLADDLQVTKVMVGHGYLMKSGEALGAEWRVLVYPRTP